MSSTPTWSHFIVTRFNLYLPFRGVKDRINLDPEWLEGRTKLLEDYCAPSVAQQSDTNFRWLIFIDPNTPQEIVDRLAACPFAEPTPLIDHEWPKIAELIKSISGDTEWIITSNLDSDDMIHRDYIKDLHVSLAHEWPNDSMFLGFRYGVSFFNGRFYRQEYPTNQFHTFVEPRAKFKTLFSVWHDKMEETAPLRVLNQPPRWATIVHGGNVANFPWGKRDLNVDIEGFSFARSALAARSPLDPVEVVMTTVRETLRVNKTAQNLRAALLKLKNRG